MSEYVCFLITILYEDALLRVALKIKHDSIKPDVWENPMEPENREILHSLLPLHVQTCGHIVEVEELFEVEVKP